MAKTSKEYAAERRAKGLCGTCKNKALPGESRCQTCKDRDAARYRANAKSKRPHAARSERDHETYEIRKIAGLCVGCGKAPQLPGSVYGKVCLEKQRARQQKRAIAHAKTQARKEQVLQTAARKSGICIDCADEDRQIFRDDRCRHCWAKWRARGSVSRHAARCEAGICQNCDNLATNTVRCDICEANRSQQRASNRKQRLCTGCSRPITSGTKCDRCKQQCREKYATRKAAGLCVDCGEPAITGQTKCALCRERARLKNRRKTKQLKDQVLDAYGGPICVGCGEPEKAILKIDHIAQNGAQRRRELLKLLGGTQTMTSQRFYRWLRDNNYPEGFRVLCPTCNKKARKGIPLPNESA